jgi:hypothetical protein
MNIQHRNVIQTDRNESFEAIGLVTRNVAWNRDLRANLSMLSKLFPPNKLIATNLLLFMIRDLLQHVKAFIYIHLHKKQ